MATPHQTRFSQKFCLAPDCRGLFYICSHCDRGHGYCSDACRARVRPQQLRQARRRHQQTPQGRLDHRDHNRAYRRRKAEAARAARAAAQEIVTDHTPQATPDSLRFAAPPSFQGRAALVLTPRRVICRLCGREGALLDPFHPLLR